jgi:hypothetical protein
MLVPKAGSLTATGHVPTTQTVGPALLWSPFYAAAHVYVRMTRPDDGAIVRGEYMQSLPPSVLSVLGGSEQGPSVIPLRTAA